MKTNAAQKFTSYAEPIPSLSKMKQVQAIASNFPRSLSDTKPSSVHLPTIPQALWTSHHILLDPVLVASSTFTVQIPHLLPQQPLHLIHLVLQIQIPPQKLPNVRVLIIAQQASRMPDVARIHVDVDRRVAVRRPSDLRTATHHVRQRVHSGVFVEDGVELGVGRVDDTEV